MGPDQDPSQQQQPPDQDNQDYSWPGHGSGGSPTGAVNTVATMAGMVGGIPLVGTALNLGEAAWDTGSMVAHDQNANDQFNAGNVDAGNAELQKEQEDSDAINGHLINAIPLVGFARAWM